MGILQGGPSNSRQSRSNKDLQSPTNNFLEPKSPEILERHSPLNLVPVNEA